MTGDFINALASEISNSWNQFGKFSFKPIDLAFEQPVKNKNVDLGNDGFFKIQLGACAVEKLMKEGTIKSWGWRRHLFVLNPDNDKAYSELPSAQDEVWRPLAAPKRDCEE